MNLSLVFFLMVYRQQMIQSLLVGEFLVKISRSEKLLELYTNTNPKSFNMFKPFVISFPPLFLESGNELSFVISIQFIKMKTYSQTRACYMALFFCSHMLRI